MTKIKVAHIIEVPEGPDCWNNVMDGPCQYFDNYGGHHTCNLGFYIPWKNKDYKKAPECLALKEVTND